MFDKGRSKEDVFRDLNVFHNMDMKYSSGRILGSMCTKPDPVGLEAYKMFIETNLGDPGLFKGTALMEQEVINSLGNLLHLKNPCGHIVTLVFSLRTEVASPVPDTHGIPSSLEIIAA